ncbi:hypothetical protein AGMMS49593_10350 [Endomicrobiia bacterium]|nr:hypothetical protein AGMMS49593_10350 [Endomicrobiia bacterium]
MLEIFIVDDDGEVFDEANAVLAVEFVEDVDEEAGVFVEVVELAEGIDELMAGVVVVIADVDDGLDEVTAVVKVAEVAEGVEEAKAVVAVVVGDVVEDVDEAVTGVVFPDQVGAAVIVSSDDSDEAKDVVGVVKVVEDVD